MKTKILLLLSSVFVLTTVAKASQADNEVVVLSTYTVTAPRYTAAEKQINASLDAAKEIAAAPLAVAADCAALQAFAREAAARALQAMTKIAVRVAKS